MGLLLALLCSGLMSPTARGGYLEIPPVFIEQMGTIFPISGQATIINPLSRDYLCYIDESVYQGQISEPVLITGMQIRLAIGTNWRVQTPASYTANTWPNVDFTMPSFRVTLGRAVPAIAAVGAFRDPVTGNLIYGPMNDYYENRVEVRSGPLTILRDSFVADGGATGVHSWGPTISFHTPYLYSPGETLVFRVQHYGIPTADQIVPAQFASRYDAWHAFSAIGGFNADADFPQFFYGSVHYVRWVTSPVPEPTAVLPLATLGLLLRRRRTKLEPERLMPTR
jgi:hypothetical protein